ADTALPAEPGRHRHIPHHPAFDHLLHPPVPSDDDSPDGALETAMAQKKASEVDRWLSRPEPAYRLVLIYGPDRGLVSERARSFAARTGLPLDDPFAVMRLDANELDQPPGRLEDEARTVPMFAEKRLIWVANAGAQKNLAADVKRVADDPPSDAIILIEAGELKKNAALRTVVEGAAAAMALPCYADDARAIDLLIDEEM